MSTGSSSLAPASHLDSHHFVFVCSVAVIIIIIIIIIINFIYIALFPKAE